MSVQSRGLNFFCRRKGLNLFNHARIMAYSRKPQPKPKPKMEEPHLEDFEYWKKWEGYGSKEFAQGSAAATFWPPFAKELEPDVEITDPNEVPRGELPRPTRELLELGQVNPRSLVERQKHLLPSDSKFIAEDHFNVQELVTLEDLFNEKVHYGHKVGTLNPGMSQYMFGQRFGICIFDLDKTLQRLYIALNVIAHIAAKGGVILFVSNSREHMTLIEETAQECGEYCHTRIWKEGTFVDSEMVFRSAVRLPDLIIMTNTLDNVFEEHPAIIEAAKMLIPTVAVVDSNCDPSIITYPIPGNDDTLSSISLYLRLFRQAIMKGKEAFARETRQESQIEKETDTIGNVSSDPSSEADEDGYKKRKRKQKRQPADSKIADQI